MTDPLRPARGILMAVAISIIMWVVAFAVVPFVFGAMERDVVVMEMRR